MRKVLSAVLAAVLTGVVGAAAGAAPATAVSSSLPLLTADNQPTWQTDGVVWAVAVVGNVAYVGGNFDYVRPPGKAVGDASQVARRNLAAFDARTGALLPFDPVVTGTPFSSSTQMTDCDDLGGGQYNCDAVWEIKASPDGSRIYVGGDFTAVDGVDRHRLAAFDTATGALVTSFKPAMSSRVRALAVTSDTVYAGGHFTMVDGVARSRLAAFTTAGALRPWFPTADRGVYAMVLAPDKSRVVIGGDFDTLNGESIHGLAAVNAVSGASMPWSSRPITLTSTWRAWVTDLVADADTVYASSNGEGGFDGRLAADPYTGDIKWLNDCRGATQAVTLLRGVLYSGSHAHNCRATGGFPEFSPIQHWRLLAEAAKPAAGSTVSPLLHWFPNTNGGRTAYNQGPRAMDNNGTHMWVGGDFTLVNGKAQEGLTRFTFRDVAPDVNLPAAFGAAPTAAATDVPGELRVTWPATWDADDATLRYDVFRDGATTAFTSVTGASNFWTLPQMSVVDTGVAPGSTHTYVVRAVDSAGNAISSSSSEPAVATPGPKPLPAILDARPSPCGGPTRRRPTSRAPS
jgi:hypothetical protein